MIRDDSRRVGSGCLRRSGVRGVPRPREPHLNSLGLTPRVFASEAVAGLLEAFSSPPPAVHKREQQSGLLARSERAGGWRGGAAERRYAEWNARPVLQAERRASAERSEAPPPSAPNLEEVTLNPHDTFRHGLTPEPDAWNIRVLTYSSGLIEAAAYTGYQRVSRRSPLPQDATETTAPVVRTAVEKKERYDCSIARSRAICRRRVLALDADHMLTLTKRGKFESVAEVWQAFRLFSQSMKRRFGERWQYVAVPELHADGETWHMHVAMRGFFWIGTLRRFWYRALGGVGDESGENTPGSTNVRHFKPRGRATAAGSVAGYVAKYVGKGGNGFDRHRRVFAASLGLDPVAVQEWSSLGLHGCKEIAVNLQRFLCSAGASSRGSAWFYSRGRITGFRLTTERERQ